MLIEEMDALCSGVKTKWMASRVVEQFDFKVQNIMILKLLFVTSLLYIHGCKIWLRAIVEKM